MNTFLSASCTALRGELTIFLAAIRFFTRIPIPDSVEHSIAGLNAASRYFPLVGLLVGLFSALMYTAAHAVSSPAVAIWVAILASLWLTGAFHEDGLSDSADGLGGGWQRRDILNIMKDSRIGNYGAITLWLALSGKFLFLDALPDEHVATALVAGHVFSRTAAVFMMRFLSYARPNDDSSKCKPLATELSCVSFATAVLTCLMVLVVCAYRAQPGSTPLTWQHWGAALLFSGIMWLWWHAKCRRWLQGYTGDTLGATQQICELAFYFGLGAQCLPLF